MAGPKRTPNVPNHVFAWYRDISKADLVEALIDAVRTHTVEGCDDINAAADEAAYEVAKAICRDGRKPHKDLMQAVMRRPPEEFEDVRGAAPAHPPMTEERFAAERAEAECKREAAARNYYVSTCLPE